MPVEESIFMKEDTSSALHTEPRQRAAIMLTDIMGFDW
jgi:hypothetical protein